MLDWLLGRRSQSATLATEIETKAAAELSLKAAGSNVQPQAVAMGAVDSVGGLTNHTNLGTTSEQLQHYRGWQYIAIRAIASRVAKQPLRVAYAPIAESLDFNEDDLAGMFIEKSMAASTEGLQPLPSHPILEAVDDPNEFLVRWSLLYVTVAQLQLTGKAYWWLSGYDGKLKIYPIPPDWVTPDHRSGLYSKWIIRPKRSASEFLVDGADIAYFALPNPVDPMGSCSPLASQADAVNLHEAIDAAQISTMNNICKPSMVLVVGDHAMPGGATVQATLTEEQRMQLLASVKKAYAGMTKFGNAIIVDGLIKQVTPFQSSVKDVEFMEGAKIAKSRILQAYGVHEFIVGESAPSSYAQATAVERVFCDSVVNPLLEYMGQVLNGWLTPKFPAPAGMKLKVWFEPATVLDPDLDQKKWEFAVSQGAATKDEYRAHMGLESQQAEKPNNAADPTAADAESTTITPSAGADAVAANDIQATALNGAQIASLLEIIQNVADGTLPADSARAVIAASFPLLTQSQIDDIVSPIKPASPSPAGEGKPVASDQSAADAIAMDSTAKAFSAFLSREVDPYSLRIIPDGDSQ